MTRPEPVQQQNFTEAPAAGLLDRIVEQQEIERVKIAARYKPVLNNQELIERQEAIKFLVEQIMVEGVDYGWVPGTRPTADPKPGEYRAKPTLFKAGAETACAFFGYVPHFTEEVVIEEWRGDKYGEPLFYYKYRCTLLKDGQPVGEGFGSGSTWESKYRYRKGERECPACGKSGAIIKGQAQYGGGWLCYVKKGGCGAKFADGDPAIEGQEAGRVANPDIADVINTVQKMAQKRSYVAATLTATGLSGRFTQDLEDMPIPPERQQSEPQREQAPPPPRQQQSKSARQSKPASQPAPPAASKGTITAESAEQAAEMNLDAVLATFTKLPIIIDTFQRFRVECLDKVFGAAEATKVYYRALKAAGVNGPDEFRGPQAAKDCFRELWGEFQNAKSAPPPAPEDDFDRFMRETEPANV